MKLLLLFMAFTAGVSLGCSATRSASSPAQPTAAPSLSQSTAPVVNPAAQEKSPCTLTMTHAPVINGLRLGLTPDEVLALFPGSKEDPEIKTDLAKPPSRFGTSGLVIRPDKFANKAEFSGINQITFTLLDGRVATFHIGYGGPKWAHVDQFVTKFVEGTSLPASDQWEPYVGMDNQMKTLTCADFRVTVFAGGEGGSLNHVQMHDLEADKKLKDRRKAAREKASPAPGQ